MSEWRRIIGGSRKHARLQLDRERRTHFGLARPGRSVKTDVPESIPDADDPAAELMHAEAAELAKRLFEGHLNDFSSDPVHRDLVRRRLVDEEPLRDLAQDLGITYANAKTIVFRGRRFLGITQEKLQAEPRRPVDGDG